MGNHKAYKSATGHLIKANALLTDCQEVLGYSRLSGGIGVQQTLGRYWGYNKLSGSIGVQ